MYDKHKNIEDICLQCRILILNLILIVGGKSMLYSIPWYVVLFQSIPEMFLTLILGFKLFNLDVDIRKFFLISCIVSIIVYFTRKNATIYGIHTAIFILSSLILIKMILQIKFTYSFICISTSSLINGLLQSLIVPILFAIFKSDTESLMQNPWLNVVYFVPCGILMVELYVYIDKKKIYIFDLKMYENDEKTLLKDKSILVLFTILMQGILILVINQTSYLFHELYGLGKQYIFINYAISIQTIFVLLSIKGFGADIENKVEMNFLKTHLKQIEGLYNVLRTQNHEHKRHIQTIQSMIYLDEIQSAKEYIDGLSQNYSRTDDIIYVGNMALTALINEKRKVAEINNIDFKFSINCILNKLKISSWDLCSILGNLLDNAFEIVMKKKNDRQVVLAINYVYDKYVLEVSNNGEKISEVEIDKIFEPGYTTKDSVGRGYGLFLTKNLIEKYGGTIEVYCQENTVFQIMFLCKEGEVSE